MSLAHSIQRKSRADDRLHKTALDQRGERVQLSSVLPGEDEVIGGVLTPRLDEVLRLRDVDDADDASGVGERQRASVSVSPPMVSKATSTPLPPVSSATAST